MSELVIFYMLKYYEQMQINCMKPNFITVCKSFKDADISQHCSLDSNAAILLISLSKCTRTTLKKLVIFYLSRYCDQIQIKSSLYFHVCLVITKS